MILDGFALIHRVYHALPNLTTKTGVPSGAVYGFCSVLLKVIQKFNPDRIVAAFDEGTQPTFRKELAPQYHANRPDKDQLMIDQINTIQEFLGSMKIRVYVCPGFEGDDIIGTLASQLSQGRNEILVVTGDYDTFQLVNAQTKVFTMRKGISDTVLFDQAAVQEKYGFVPELLVDYKALMGDPSDNYSGVSGIGPKTAQQLVQKFGTVENIYALIEKNRSALPAKDFPSDLVQKKLSQGKAQAFLSKTLARIRTDVPIRADQVLKDARVEVTPEARAFFERMGFDSLLKRLEGNQASVQPRPRRKPLTPTALRLFS